MPNQRRVIKAVIPAAGLGTRMLPATKVVPKEMLPVAGKPLIQYAIEEAASSGIETVIVIVRQHSSLIQAHFAADHELESLLEQRGLSQPANLVDSLAKLAKLQFVSQDRPLGLGHAISCARPFLGEEPFAVLLPDVIMVSHEPVVSQLIRAHQETGGSIVAIREVSPHDVERFGIVQVPPTSMSQAKRLVRLTGLVEKPSAEHAPSRLGVFGRYLLEPSIWVAIAKSGMDTNGEIQLTDALNLLCQDRPVLGLCFDGRHYDAGDPIGYLKANVELSLEDSLLAKPLHDYFAAVVSSVTGRP